MHVIIKNFGKVESADIALNNLVVFVGNNNSGKTMVMQLIYGLRKKLKNFLLPTEGIKKFDSVGQNLIRCDQDWFRKVESNINTYLAENKLQIIKGIYGRSISAEEIKIALEGAETASFVSSVSEYQTRDAAERKSGLSIETLQYENNEVKKSYNSQIPDWEGSEDIEKETLKIVWRIMLSGKTSLDSRQLFLPASRSGLQLLYRHYFAGEAERNLVMQAEGNLVMPIKEFLCFLQRYAEDMQLGSAQKELLEFGEEHLLQGKVVQRGDEAFYVDRYTDRTIPFYIASSMIHELTPFIKALNAEQRIDWLYCDEVENSLHPLMQREMARWLIRMANAGMHIMISSHSDTMASRLNNLFMLTQLHREKADYGLLSELELKEADLLHPDVKASVYEFRIGKQGRTSVEELEFISCPLMGYDFQLFGRNLDKLYDEAEKITR